MLEQLQINASIAPDYAACYCEENTFLALRQLTGHAAADAQRDYYAVFVSNPSKQVGHLATSHRVVQQPEKFLHNEVPLVHNTHAC